MRGAMRMIDFAPFAFINWCCVALMFIATWADMKIYKNRHTRYLVSEEKIVRNRKALFKELLKVNATEVGFLMTGLWLGFAMGLIA
jgi:hypothetical protein